MFNGWMWVLLLVFNVFVIVKSEYSNPCSKAAGYMNDIALGDDEYRLASQVEKEVKEGKPTDEILAKNKQKRGATSIAGRLWDDGVIPYTFDEAANWPNAHKSLFRQAMDHWEKYTCLTFVPRDPASHHTFINFQVGTCGCCSFVGKRGYGGQGINLGEDCARLGIVIHELGHAVGFWHEQSRPDRDGFIEMLAGSFGNDNYAKQHDIDSLGQPYDFLSIMHYKLKSAEGEVMMRVRPEHADTVDDRAVGQRVGLSEGDITQANLLYKCPVCGGTFQDASGTFSKPSSSNDNTCQWRISTKVGQRISVSVDSFHVPCGVGELEIRDGNYRGSPLIGRFCGSNVPQTVESKTRRMWIQLTTTRSGASLSASYKAKCGKQLTEPGTLQSPGFPSMYSPNADCQWKITAPQGRRIALRFDSFEIERTDGCQYDFLEIQDGGSVLGRYCGYDKPADVTSRSSELLLQFASDKSVQKEGFKITFWFV